MPTLYIASLISIIYGTDLQITLYRFVVFLEMYACIIYLFRTNLLIIARVFYAFFLYLILKVYHYQTNPNSQRKCLLSTRQAMQLFDRTNRVYPTTTWTVTLQALCRTFLEVGFNHTDLKKGNNNQHLFIKDNALNINSKSLKKNTILMENLFYTK